MMNFKCALIITCDERALHILGVASITQQLNRDEDVNKICDIERAHRFVVLVCGKRLVEQLKSVCERLERVRERVGLHEQWVLPCERQR